MGTACSTEANVDDAKPRTVEVGDDSSASSGCSCSSERSSRKQDVVLRVWQLGTVVLVVQAVVVLDLPAQLHDPFHVSVGHSVTRRARAWRRWSRCGRHDRCRAASARSVRPPARRGSRARIGGEQALFVQAGPASTRACTRSCHSEASRCHDRLAVTPIGRRWRPRPTRSSRHRRGSDRGSRRGVDVAETGSDTTCGPAPSNNEASTSQQQCTPTVATGSTAAIADDTRSTPVGRDREPDRMTSSANGSSMITSCGEPEGLADGGRARTWRAHERGAADVEGDVRRGSRPQQRHADRDRPGEVPGDRSGVPSLAATARNVRNPAN